MDLLSLVVTKPIFRFSGWDFSTILKTNGFLDKTLLIKKIMEKENFLLILAPRLSGKSTILNMLKKFLEITVDTSGKQKDIKESINYELFVKNNFKIFQEDNIFFYKHFGSYPVIFIDYYPLRVVNNFLSLLKQFREVIVNSFEPHDYLIDCIEIWEDENCRNKFKKYCQFYGNFSLTEDEIINSFSFLSKLLFKRFNRCVYVLMDNFDTFVESPYLKDSPDKDRIIEFISTVNHRVFKSNKYICRSFILGPVRQESVRLNVPTHKVLPKNVIEYNSQKYNCFSEFFGVTLFELDYLTTKFYSKSYLREKVKNIVIGKSTEIEHKMQIYSLWSVLRYLSNFNIMTECLC